MKKSPIRIMLVDDNEVVRSSLKLFFESCHDFQLIGEAADGHEAVFLSTILNPDVILMDINMPKMNGIEATRIIHQRCPDLVILALTSLSDDGSVQKILEAGAYSTLSKQIAIDDIAKSIREVFDRYYPNSPLSVE